MRFGLDGALTGGVGTTDLWVWPLSADAPILIGQRGGGACWLGARVMAQVADRLVYLDRETGWQPTPVVDPMNGRPDTLGANWLQASLGGRTWCGTRESTPHYTRGFFMGQPFQDDKNVLAVSPQDDLILSDLVVRWATGGVTPLPADLNVESLRVRDGLVAYVDTGGRAHVMTANGELPVQWRGPGQAVPLAWRVGGMVMVAYFTEADGMIVHLATDRSRGASFGRVAFSFDVFLDVDDWAYYGFALGSGEDANVAVRQRRRLPEQFADLDAPIVVAPVVDEPPAAVPAIAPWPCRVSFFFDDPRNPNHLQRDARLRSSDGTRWLALPDVSDALVFCTLPGTREGTDAGLADAIAEARRTGKPLGAYRDTFDFPPSAVPSVPGVEVIPIVNAYPWRRADGMEPVYDAYVRLHATVADLRAAGHARIGFAVATYRQIGVGGDLAVYNWPIQYVADLFGLVCELAREQGVRDLFCFEWSRANGKDGIVSRPELITLTVRLLEAAQPVIETHIDPLEILMSARLPKSHLTPSRTFPGRWLYRLSTGRYLSVDGSSGTLRPGGTSTDGDSEAFEWDGTSDHCDIAPGNSDGLRFPFGVDLTR